MTDFDINGLHTPCYVVDERLIRRNMEILKGVSDKTGCKILLAQKAFSMYSLYPLMSKYLAGTAASGLFEAKLGYEEMPGREVHIFSPAYRPDEFREITQICGHIIFNSPGQLKKFYPIVEEARKQGREISVGMRVNPGYSEIETEIYNPCTPRSRLGAMEREVNEEILANVDGLHFHALCEQDSGALERTVPHFEKRFGRYLKNMKWLNMGGGHHITKEGYDIDRLCRVTEHFKETYGVEVYLEPGEACALNAGFLVTEILEVRNTGDVSHVITDTSAACHMPDVTEMPYRPEIIGSGNLREKPYTYIIGAPTCLAGDVIGEYSFDKPLHEGDRLVFTDMAIYTMCKNNTFNGIGLPYIYIADSEGNVRLHKKFGYEDFKERL
ncbi:MAG: carboxynorspermidine decarboxylase [Ruminococcus sp.]|nr:carboxynorspermidine decarboxylase [Ruminococcus sp.]